MKDIYNKKRWVQLFVIAMICTIISCKKFLDKKSDSVLVEPTTLNDLQGLLDDATLMNETATPVYGEESSDEYFLQEKYFNLLISGQRNIYTWKAFDIGSGNDWSCCYEKIYNSNYSLDAVSKIGRTTQNEAAWDNVKGSALFYRSYYFLWLLWNYSKAYDSSTAGKDLGIALRLTSNFNIKSTRATTRQCYQQVITDTKAAIPLLPTYPQQLMRPSKGAAYGLLARCYLSMGDYNNALLYSDSCLQLNHRLMDYNGDNDITSIVGTNSPFKQFNKETVFYTEMDKYGGLEATKSRSRIDTVLYALYDKNDLRQKAFYSLNADGYAMYKGSYTANAYNFFTGIATDEMYLTRAECYIRENQLQKGLNDLDTLLIKRYKSGTFIPLTASSQDSALDIVLKERRKEMVLRGMRWMDIKRLNKGGSNIILKRVENGVTYTLQPNANFYALPLPADIIQLTGMQQNEP